MKKLPIFTYMSITNNTETNTNSNVDALTGANNTGMQIVAKKSGGTSIGNKIGSFFRSLSDKILHRHRKVSLRSMETPNTKIKPEESRENMEQVQGDNLPIHEKHQEVSLQSMETPNTEIKPEESKENMEQVQGDNLPMHEKYQEVPLQSTIRSTKKPWKKRTKIRSEEGKAILKQIQNNNLPMHEKLKVLQTSNLYSSEKEAIKNEFIKKINYDRALAGEESLGSIQDIIDKPGIIVNSIRNNTTDLMLFLDTTKKFFGPDGFFPLESLSEAQKTNLFEALQQSDVLSIRDLSQLPLIWADFEARRNGV